MWERRQQRRILHPSNELAASADQLLYQSQMMSLPVAFGFGSPFRLLPPHLPNGPLCGGGGWEIRPGTVSAQGCACVFEGTGRAIGAASAPSLRSVEIRSRATRTRGSIGSATPRSPCFWLLFSTVGILPSALRAAFGVPTCSRASAGEAKKSDSATADRAKRRPGRSPGADETARRSNLW